MPEVSDEFIFENQSKHEKLNTLHSLLERSGVDVEELFRVKEVKVWQGFNKDDDGNPVTTDLMGVVLSPTWAEGPQWPVVQQADPVKIPAVKSKPRSDNAKRVMLMPDPQIGFRLYLQDDGTPVLDPFHDEQAIDVALQLCRYMKPDVIVNLGDTLDFPEFGRYEQEPEFQQTTQLAINRGYEFLAQQRAIRPDAEIHLIEGNHDRRLPNAIKKNAMAALRIKRADEPQGWPVMSVPHLLRLDELDVNYVDGYPAAKVELAPGLFAIHGQKIASSSSTAAKVVNTEAASKVFGHVHRCELQWRTIETESGIREIFGMTPGCLCRVDGAVPSYHSSTTAHGVPVPVLENWQQGVGFIDIYDDGDIQPYIVRIKDGVASWQGKTFTSTV